MLGDKGQTSQDNGWQIFGIGIAVYLVMAVAFVYGWSALRDQSTSETLGTFWIPLLFAFGLLLYRTRPKD